MGFRMPQNLSPKPAPETGADLLQAELLAEQAAALGRGGRDVEAALKRLRDFDATGAVGPLRPGLVAVAADAVWGFLVHRELCGLRDRDDVIREDGIPAEVLCRLGAR
ncbi:MAG TPA: DUF6665 family protein [Aliidongia sp.]|uniref:DUF6665 family protein n=1 Tax=Aliidongia sp. TaxID=1914230 RepID=UPI002DDD8F4B|nr:DUF6665 family protein [Aliidongia sp.]HEV2676522.1 DUF6665 family protein [Aliidongia sp.]